MHSSGTQISLIDRVHKIYNDTVWQDRSDQEGFKGMGFVIKKIVVHSEPTRVRGGEAHYNMIREKWDVRNLLEVFSREYSHKDFCLAHLFTDLKFEGGILGLAYVGSPRRNSVGGICTPGLDADEMESNSCSCFLVVVSFLYFIFY